MGDGDLGESQAEDRPRDDGSLCENQAADSQTNDTASRAMVRRLEEVAAQLQQEVARLGGMQHAASATQQLALLRDELHGMGELIANTRAEIAGLMPLGAPSSRLTSASDELDAVVGATERAAVEIMGAAEHAQEAAQRLRKINGLPVEALRDLDQVEAAAVDIFMACSFQDLTGQRIRKVVQALTYIEKRIIALTVLWRGAGRGAGWGDAAGAAPAQRGDCRRGGCVGHPPRRASAERPQRWWPAAGGGDSLLHVRWRRELRRRTRSTRCSPEELRNADRGAYGSGACGRRAAMVAGAVAAAVMGGAGGPVGGVPSAPLAAGGFAALLDAAEEAGGSGVTATGRVGMETPRLGAGAPPR